MSKTVRARIFLPVKTFSINKMYYATQKVKTKEAREWYGRDFNYLDDPAIQVELEKIRSAFDPKKHALFVHLKAHYDPARLFTKDGRLSGRAHDITNWEKPLIDLLFLPKYFNQKPPKGAPNLNVDDKYLIGCSSSKIPNKEIGIKIEIKILDLDRLF